MLKIELLPALDRQEQIYKPSYRLWIISFLCYISIGSVFAQTQDPKPADSVAQTESSAPAPAKSAEEKPATPAASTEVKEKEKEKPPAPPFKSPWKGKLDGELLSNLLLTPEHQDSVKKNSSLWLTDNLRFGFQIRPRFENYNNQDFDKSTNDSKNYVTQNTQFWTLLDINESFAVKFTIQDSRLYGQYKDPSGTGYGPTAFTNSIGTVYDTTKAPSNQVPVKNNTDIREAYVIWKDFLPNTKVYFGRQTFSYGDSRIIGSRNDSQLGNSFDGARIAFDTKTWSTHAGYAILAEESSGPNGFATANSQKVAGANSLNDTYLAFLYNSWKPSEEIVLDAYEIGVIKKYNTTTSKTLDPNTRTNGRDNLLTSGLRLSNRTASGRSLPAGKSWDWGLEYAVQTGSTGQQIDASWDQLHTTIGSGTNKHSAYKETVQHDASFFVAQTGYTYKGFRIGAQFARASGDPNRADGKSATWDPLFATRSGGFPYFDSGNGIANAAFWANVRTTSIHVQYYNEDYGRFIFAVYDIRKDKTQDAWYDGNRTQVTGSSGFDANGNFVAGKTVTGSTENYSNNPYLKNWQPGHRLMLEYDLIYIKKVSEYLSIWAGATVLYAGDAIKNQKQYNYEKTSTYYSFTLQFAI
ncbi:hypothetical protein EHQ53_16865 [Leptospira langatensis]|uniref:Alginate export domain-containing protein n=1 Tax=Leptospira langatensis TaxID=2484983 RepID=A0A5F1ZNN5_9LEPT|nr:alginate export family protein [Leptospira langatensis]TGK05312.1 hypothetical protein EHO57_01105 [Leptospira langatensis]TGL38448.1 hypothetical protein EHQ53_16865 [Leptospira langatensis]